MSIYFSEKHYRFRLILKIKKNLYMKITKILILHEGGYTYEDTLKIISDTSIATIASYEDYDNE